ncbi:anti-sigma factor [Agreia sp. PsM10]|uniref:anti-sigma factor n=1 Tax=Agreia sp. PsM10 TaxID=3030533 RepID=UPI00263ABFF8|nr:anti-sigma factor [Agreia sp. PsM10]MDN4641061.1 anti-sigma factor [Agreia sp. PsM10]
MTHIDADELALIALGEVTPSEIEAEHLASCAACAAELRELSTVVRRGRSAQGESLAEPSPAVWERIRTQISADTDVAAAVRPVSGAEMSQMAASPAEKTPSAPSQPASERARRRWRTRMVVPLAVAALVVGLVAGTGVGIWWQSAQSANTGVVVAGAELDPFPDWADAHGSAVVEVLADGTRQVVVDIDTAGQSGPADDRLREVWLISADGTALVSIGFLDGAEGRFDLPSGVDLATYSLVDVSAEPDDGDATHSGDSIVRGELRSI